MIPQGRFLRGFFHCSGRLSWILEVPSISGPMIQPPRLAVVEGSTRRHENSSGIWPVGSLNWVSEVKGQITLAGICQLPGNKKCSPRVPGYLGEGEEAEEEGRNTLIAQFSSEAAVPVVDRSDLMDRSEPGRGDGGLLCRKRGSYLLSKQAGGQQPGRMCTGPALPLVLKKIYRTFFT